VEKDQELLIQLGEMDAKVLPVPPESQFDNPVERSVQTIVKGIGAIFASQEDLSNSMWNLALLEFLDVCNVYWRIFSMVSLGCEASFVSLWVTCCLSDIAPTKINAPHGEFGFAIGLGDNNATLEYIPSRSTRRVYWRRRSTGHLQGFGFVLPSSGIPRRGALVEFWVALRQAILSLMI
jgi:hypothetical protein